MDFRHLLRVLTLYGVLHAGHTLFGLLLGSRREEQFLGTLRQYRQMLFDLAGHGEQGGRHVAQLLDARLLRRVLLENIRILDLVVESGVVDADEHVIDAQKVSEKYEESGRHDALYGGVEWTMVSNCFFFIILREK